MEVRLATTKFREPARAFPLDQGLEGCPYDAGPFLEASGNLGLLHQAVVEGKGYAQAGTSGRLQPSDLSHTCVPRVANPAEGVKFESLFRTV